MKKNVFKNGNIHLNDIKQMKIKAKTFTFYCLKIKFLVTLMKIIPDAWWM